MQERIDLAKEYLVDCPEEDIAKHRGYIMALRDILALDFSEEE